jgi:1-deoxy-D-xylulose-5-phosphate reductoisomerase
MDSVRRLAILGCTGSIGRQVLEVVRSFPERFEVVALAAGRNIELLREQVEEFRPKLVFAHSLNPDEATPLEEMATHPDVDLIVIATSGKAGLMPTLSAIRYGKAVALANKEALVMAGELLTTEARRCGATILPVDSEHSAIWQCLTGEDREQVSRIILTASGGPFQKLSPKELTAVTAEEALRHPTWRMGKKVTIDSATLMNKGFEVIEAHWLFNFPWEKIEAVLHAESTAHCFVEFSDGSIKCLLSPPDMRIPIQYALTYPERWQNPELPRLNLTQLRSLTFAPIDEDRFPCFRLAVEAGRRGGTYPAALCAADEIAVELFLQGRIGFVDIAELVQSVLSQHQGISHPQLEEILDADAWARKVARELTLR